MRPRLQAGERLCAACEGTRRVEVTEAPRGPYGEEPVTRLERCDDCDGIGIARCGARGDTKDLDASGTCPACADDDAHGRAPDATDEEVAP